MRRRSVNSIALALATFMAGPVYAQGYPSGPIRIVVGFGAGSTADVLSRLVGKNIETRLGQPVVIENRPGNSSMTAADMVARAPKDGYTLLMGTVANTLGPIQSGSSFDLGKSLEPVALLGVVPNVLVAHPSVPANNLDELVRFAKANPGNLTFGTSGNGTANHLAAELFNQKAGTKIVAVPYSGGSNQGLSDLLSGRITLMFGQAGAFAPQVSSGKLKAIAVGQSTRTPIMPDVPTTDEGGMTGIDVGIWIGLLAPRGTPSEIVEKLANAANDALRDNVIVVAMKAQGIDPLGSSPKEFAEFIPKDIRKWSSILAVTEAGK